MSHATQKLLTQLLKKIPIFDGLPPSQVRQLLSICRNGLLEEGERIFMSDTPSDEMYILLTGQLSVVTAEGLRVATILPVTTVGEMGVITGQPRSATVEAIKKARILTIKKPLLDQLMFNDTQIRNRIYRNIVQILADKLINDNVHLRDYRIEKNQYLSRVRTLEYQIQIKQKRFEFLLEFMESKSIGAQDELKSRLEEKMMENAPRILIVDDEADFRTLVVKALPYFEVLEAGNGREGLELVGDNPPDLVITNIKMPEMDGFELLEALRQQYGAIPVLAISGYVESTEIEDHGFNGIILKPLRIKNFRELIDQTLKMDD